MRISVLDAGNFKLDGGSMFGVVPKSIWSKNTLADANNMCNFNMRCLLIEDGNRLTLVDTGMGNKQPDKWQSYYYRNGNSDLKSSLKNAGYDVADLTDVILTHLHFDHCGGAVEWNSSKEFYIPTFPNAKYWTHSEHYNSTLNPNPREKATFLTENIQPLKAAGQLFFIDRQENEFNHNYEFVMADGHTEKMLMLILSVKGSKLLFAADTIPTSAHVHVPFVMSYDIHPLKTMEEKSNILTRVVHEDIVVVYDHDINFESSKIIKTEKGFRPLEPGPLADFIS